MNLPLFLGVKERREEKETKGKDHSGEWVGKEVRWSKGEREKVAFTTNSISNISQISPIPLLKWVIKTV